MCQAQKRELPKLNVFPVLATLPSRVNLKQISAAIFHGPLSLSLFLKGHFLAPMFERALLWGLEEKEDFIVTTPGHH